MAFLCSLEIIFSFLIKMSSLKAIEIEFAFFHPLGNPDVAFLVWPDKPGKLGKPRNIREFEKLSKSQGNLIFLWKKNMEISEKM